MKKPNQYEDEPEPNQIIGVGSYQSTQKAGKVKTQPIGFIQGQDVSIKRQNVNILPTATPRTKL